MLSSYDIEILVGGFLVLAVYGYAAFWGFNIRKGLMVKLYRNQALGIGLVGVGLAYFTFAFDGLVNFANFGNVGNGIAFALVFFAPLPLFYWTDQSLRAARQSDPLERDQFHWRRAGKILWIVIWIALVYNLLWDIYSYYVPSAQYYVPSLENSTGLLSLGTTIAAFASFGIPLASSAILLPFAWRRSYDLTFRRHLKWFALAAISLGFSFVWLLLFSPLSSDFLLVQYALLLLSGYFLYHSARAVIPLYTFQDEIRAK
jgi:hypothetical protein